MSQFPALVSVVTPPSAPFLNTWAENRTSFITSPGCSFACSAGLPGTTAATSLLTR